LSVQLYFSNEKKSRAVAHNQKMPAEAGNFCIVCGSPGEIIENRSLSRADEMRSPACGRQTNTLYFGNFTFLKYLTETF